ncbi:Rrf2 family transcriptional regulator [bacterium]|nr:Rrf2 family transcriptional regulator [bacterium]
MKLSVKSDYACRAVQALALHYPNQRPLRIEDIARRESVPANYLVQILIELKAKGIIQSRRGKAGGYLLAKTPAAITFGDVVRAVQGEILELSALEETSSPQEFRRIWQRIKSAADDIADNTTFEQLCTDVSRRSLIYYI